MPQRSLLVVDASIMAGILFEEDQAAQTLEAIAASSADGLIAPDLLVLELSNVVISNRRRMNRRQGDGVAREGNRSAEAVRPAEAGFYGVPCALIAREITRRLSSADIALESMMHEQRLSRAIQIAELHRLSLHDACYLALAAELGAMVATFDAEMRRAALDLGLRVLPSGSSDR
ncbi:MAG: type II toxin-antitoxin system VapC family toxin [Planctomycetaceae bacterium]|nr:type II toxin-antitoxin system VapC family toxin [Planctomycetaceae bacterium]